VTTPSDRLAELQPFVEAARAMQGWAFEYEPVPAGPPFPWDYAARARELLAGARSVLDMGTGGGEFYAEALAGYAGRALATEAWPPNVPVAHCRLAPLGAAVAQADSLCLPFAAGSFDLVLNRHEELDPADVARVLAPGGTVLTQQVHAHYHAELRDYFPRMTVYDAHHDTYAAGLVAAGLQVTQHLEHSQPVAYRHLGHLVYLLAVAPWHVTDFDLAADLDALLAAERGLRRPEGIVLGDRRYFLEARKPE
jgi:SAM-dependent methyltransferase